MLEKSMNQEPNSINQEFPIKKGISHDLLERGCQMYKNTDANGDFESQEEIHFPIHYSLVETLSKEECFDGKKIIINIEIK